MRRWDTRVVAHRANELTDRLSAFSDRVEILHDCSDGEVDAGGLDRL
jgi:hypothetical protein